MNSIADPVFVVIVHLLKAVLGDTIATVSAAEGQDHGHWRPQAWARGHLPSPGKVEKFYRVKNSISEVSLNGRDAAFP